MKDIKVKQIMIPLSDYATVSENDSLSKAYKVLKEVRAKDQGDYRHRAVLVYDEHRTVIGKVSLRDFLKALEPKYRQFEHPENTGSIGLSRFGLNQDFLRSMVENFSLWDETLEELVKKAAKLRVKEIMYSPSKEEFVDFDSSSAEAVHQFILGCHQSLLVLKEGRVVGIIRLSDIFNLVGDFLE